MQQNLLTHSRMSSAKSCLRRHYFAYELGIRPNRDSQPLRMGAAFHLGIDLLAQGVDPVESASRAVAGYEVVPQWCASEEDVDEWMIEREIVARLIVGYHLRWGRENVEIVATEQAFILPIKNLETGGVTPNFRFAGKIDKIAKLPDGRLAIIEHKTTSSIDDDYWMRLRLDTQISGYMLAARVMGHDVTTVLYDVVRKPSIRPKLIRGVRETIAQFGDRLALDLTERPDFYFARREIPRLESDLDEFLAELWQQQQLLRECQRTGRWYRNTNSCLHPFKCPYFALCCNGVNATDQIPDGFVKVTNVHQELEPPTERVNQ